MKTTMQVDLEIPNTPNFIRIKGRDDSCIPIEDLPDSDLRCLGEAWIAALIDRAQKKRCMKKD